jgi:hypothetical protein
VAKSQPSTITLLTIDPLSGVKERWVLEFSHPSQVDSWPPKLERAAGLFSQKPLRHRNAPPPEFLEYGADEDDSGPGNWQSDEEESF